MVTCPNSILILNQQEYELSMKSTTLRLVLAMLQELDRQYRPSKTGPMFGCNENKDLCCWILHQQNDSEKIADSTEEEGVAGSSKTYFKAFVDQTTKQLVVLPTMLPMQLW